MVWAQKAQLLPPVGTTKEERMQVTERQHSKWLAMAHSQICKLASDLGLANIFIEVWTEDTILRGGECPCDLHCRLQSNRGVSAQEGNSDII